MKYNAYLSRFRENTDFMFRPHVLRICGYLPFQTTYGLRVPKAGLHRSRPAGAAAVKIGAVTPDIVNPKYGSRYMSPFWGLEF